MVLGDGLTTIYGHSDNYTDTSGDNGYEQYGAFAGCVSLTNIVFGSSLRTIGNQCFTRCTSLPRLSLPDTVATLGVQCFYGATSLKEVSLGTGLKSMGAYAFGACTALKDVVFRPCDTPQLAIAESAFRGCTKLESVSLSQAVTSIGLHAFKSCSALKRIDIPDSVTGISAGAFTWCTSLGEVVLGDGLTTIYGHSESWTDTDSSNGYEQYGAFAGCVSLTNIVFGSSLRTIGNQCFTRCSSLTSLTLPDTLTSIGVQCFYDCTMLGKVVFGNRVTSIGAYAFGKCPCLRWVHFRGDPPTNVGNYAFNGMKTAAVVFREDDNTEWPATWRGYAVKPASEITPDADAPWDLVFYQIEGWPSSFFLTAESNSYNVCTRFVAGNPIYCAYAYKDAWADADIPVCFSNALHISGINKISYGWRPDGLKAGNYWAYGNWPLRSNLQNLSPGEYTATLVLNEPRSIRETNYANNSNSVTFVVVPSTAITFMSLDYEVGVINFEKGGTYGTLPDAPVRFGYKFTGWFTAEEGGIRITESSRVPNEPTTLYAQWIAAPNETITVTSNPTSGTTWQSGNLYVVAENITVPSGVVLTIQPGAIVKFKAGKSLTIASGATLRAQGTRAMPIVITSINDDANGGKTEGSTSKPNGGDWNRVQVNGTAIFEFCKIYYTSGTENYGGIECGGSVTFNDSEIADTKYECVNAHSGSFTAHNSVFRDSSLAFGYYGGDRVRVYNCVVANCTTAVRQSSKLFYNTIFYNCRNFTDQGGDGSKFYYCCFFNPVGYGDQNSAKYARETCIWADPQFVNTDKNDYRIKVTSPCVDAGDGSVAPEFDHYGSPRMNVENVRPTGIASASGAVPDIGIYEVPGTADVPAADLTVTGVSAPKTLTIGKTARISWTVENVGEVDASGQWRDVVEIVTSNGQVLELGEQIATLDVRVGKRQTFTGDFVVPCGTEGPCRVRVTANKYRDLFEGGRMDNNAGTTADASELVVEAKRIPTDGSETPVTLGAGNETAFALGYFGDSSAVLAIRCEGDISAWLGNGNTATKGNAVRTAVQVASDLWLLEIPAGTDARVSLGNDGLEPFSVALSLAVGDFLLCDIGKVTALNTGTVTVPFAGIGFDDGITCWLAQNGSRIADAKEIFVNDAVSGSAVFDVHGLAPGVYSICVKKGDDEDSVPALELIRAQDAAARWNCGLDLASTIRANRTYVGRFEYENLGDAPMNVPYITLQSSGGTLIRLSESDAWTDSIDVLALSSTYPASSLKPGEVGEIKFFYRTKSERANVTFKCAGATRVVDERGQYFRVGTAQPMQNGVVIYQDAHKKIIRYTIVTKVSHVDDPVDWPTILLDCKPHNVDALPWSFSNPKLAAVFGKTWKTYIARLAEDADYLMRLGQPTYRVDKLLQLEMNDALGIDNAVPVLASSTDIVRSGRGLDIAFTRTYSPSMSRRLTKGTLGYGWYGSYGTYAQLKDANTLVFYMPSGLSYSFTKVSGAWEPEDSRDQTVLTETDAAYELVSPSGMVQKYSKGTMRLASISDNQGNSLTFAYAGTKVSRVTHSDGQYLTFAYSGDLLTSVSDDLGHTVSYAYDNNRLATVTRVDGLVTHYGYRGDDGSSCAKALVQITAPNGTTRDFTYGSDGRLATVSVNGDKQTTCIVRGKFGSYSIIAPDGGETTVTVGVNGETLKTVNALGQTVKQTYTADSLLESVIAPSGKRNLISYDKLGNPVSAMSASGASTVFAYTEAYGNLDSVTDPKGQILAFGYDDLGRGVSSKFVDGSETRVEYNDKGDVVKTTNRRGQSVAYQYDAEGRLVKKTWDDGRIFTLAYDAKGNVVSVADSRTGSVTMEYDENERLTRIVYPKDRGFTYTYDAAGRVTERTALGGSQFIATEKFSYDSLGRLATVTDGDGTPYLTNAYDPATGRLVTQTYGNGTVVSNAYDLLGRTIGIYHGRAVSMKPPYLAFFEYAYDADGKCISQTTAEGTESYTYDADGQLTAVSYPDGTSESFTYDAVGNRISHTTGGSQLAATAAYTVNTLNQYTQIDGTTLEYDLDGNMTRNGDTRYYYDPLNRLIAVTNTAQNIRWSCEYDVFGNRVSVTDDGTTTEKVFVQGSLPSVSAEYVDGSLTKRHILVGAVRLASLTTLNSQLSTRFYHSDLLGSARLLTDGTGATKGARSFKAFGETRKSSGETTDAGYVGTLGVETDSNGLLFMRNRYYSAGMGRFVQMDPIGLEGGDTDYYRYCINSPADKIDSCGLFFEKLDGFGSYLWNNTKSTASWMWNNFKNGDGKALMLGGKLGYHSGRVVSKCLEYSKVPGISQRAAALNRFLDAAEFNYKVGHGLGQIGGRDVLGGLENLTSAGASLVETEGMPWLAELSDATTVIDNGFSAFEDIMEIKDFLKNNWKSWDETVTETVDVVISWDPNEIKGPLGTGEKRYVEQGEWMNYTIYFENKTNATAAAQEVFVDFPMDENLDWSTLELGEIAFGEHIDMSLSGKSYGKASYAMPSTNTFVKTQVSVVEKDGQKYLSWYMRDWDPTTADNFPESATGGFLPPNNPETHCGEGHLSFRVRVKPDAPNGAVIRASAQIVFDQNPMIETDPSWWNTVGRDTPMANFIAAEVEASEGEALEVCVAGGNADKASSVDVYLTYNTAASADVDLAKGKLDGAMPKGGLKFPLTLSWAKGEVGEKVITIPVKTDKTVEGDEFFTLQLANAQGVELGEVAVCTVTIKDTNTYATLQDGVMNPNIKVSTSGDGKWVVGVGSARDESGSLGLYHAESPSLAQGKSSKLSFGAVKGNGKFVFSIRFTGDPNEEVPSSLAVYNGKKYVGALDHSQVTNEWKTFNITTSGGSASTANNYSFVFTQGSDPNCHVEISEVTWSDGSSTPVYNVRALASNVCGGYVTGSGPYIKGQTAKLTAKSLPGWSFDGWYAVTYDEKGENPSYKLWNKSASVSYKATADLSVMAFFSKIPYIRGLADPADGGKVAGSGLCDKGKKVTLKATANKNFTFMGWRRAEDAAVGSPMSDVENNNTEFVATTPTLVIDRSAKPAANSKTSTTITNVTGDVTFYAVFKSYPEVFVTVDATDGKGADPTGKGVGKYVAGTITGMGKYAVGKTKIALKATANKGYVFAGWLDAYGAPLTMDATYTIAAMGEDDVEYVAKFVTIAEDKDSIKLSVDSEELSSAPTFTSARTNFCGVAMSWQLAADALSATKVKVSGLPTGLKFTDKPVTAKVGTGKTAVTVTNVPANTIYGAPTAASKMTTDKKTGATIVTPSAVKVTVTTAGKSSQTFAINLYIDPLPAWAVGTFDGEVEGGGIVQAFTVATSGKISGKLLENGKTWALSANAFDAVEGQKSVAEGQTFFATVIGKTGKNVVTNDVTVASENGIGVATSQPFNLSTFQPFNSEWTAYQNLWKRTDTKAEMPIFKKNFDVTLELGEAGDANNTVKLTFKKDGVVAFAGKVGGASVSGSSQLVWGENGWQVTLYAPPKGAFAGFCETLPVTLAIDGQNVVTGVAAKEVSD